jgi:hypothetical protein
MPYELPGAFIRNMVTNSVQITSTIKMDINTQREDVT